MKFSELVRLLEQNGFRIVKEKGSIRYYRKPGWDKLIRVDYHGPRRFLQGLAARYWKPPASAARKENKEMIDLPYALIIEATEEPDYFGFYSPDLEGFSGIGHSVEDCIYKARWGMKEHIALLEQHGLPVPPLDPNPKIVIQNEEKRVVA